MITQLDATNYRCFERLAVPLGEFCIIAGANGSGKTTLLDLPVLLGDLLGRRHVAGAFLERLLGRGARASSLHELTFRTLRQSFSLGIEARLPEELRALAVREAPVAVQRDVARQPTHIRYELRLRLDEALQLQVENEYLFLFPLSSAYETERLPVQGENAHRKDWRFILRRDGGAATRFRPELRLGRERTAQVDATRPAFARLQYESGAEYPAGRWLLDLLLTGVLFFDPLWRDLRRASPPGFPRSLMGSGENLTWIALQLQRSNPERFADWIAHVRTALPQISNIHVEVREEDRHAYFRVSYEGGFEVTSSGLSEGTLRVLALTLLAYQEQTPPLIIVEEPENSIHPQAIATVLQSLRSLYGRQIWISTHSPVVLAESRLSELVVTSLARSGAATVVPGPEHPQLGRWQGGIDLGTLFATGVFG